MAAIEPSNATQRVASRVDWLELDSSSWVTLAETRRNCLLINFNSLVNGSSSTATDVSLARLSDKKFPFLFKSSAVNVLGTSPLAF